MKWGVRKSGKSSGGSTLIKKKSKKEPEEIHEDYAKSHYKKSVKSMSDEELRERINRLQMENQYQKLTTTNINKGRDIALAILGNSSKQTLTNFVAKSMTKGVELGMTTLMDTANKRR